MSTQNEVVRIGSLETDSIFVKAIGSDSDLMEFIGGRLYGTAIPLPDNYAENVPVPYVIVTFDGLNNDAETKDSSFEGESDVVRIGIEVAAKSLDQLHRLTQMVRETVLGYMEQHAGGEDFPIEDYTFSAQQIVFDSLKPCFWQVLNYSCDVITLVEYEVTG